jgi:hypothetical protein
MSYINIIQIITDKDNRKELISESDIIEDNFFNERCVYGGEPKEYEEEIKYIAKYLRPVAFVNKRKRTITFKSKRTVTEAILKGMRIAVRRAHDSFRKGKGRSSFYSVENDIGGLCLTRDIFYLNYCRPLMDILQDYTEGYIPRTVWIGSILDGHY